LYRNSIAFSSINDAPEEYKNAYYREGKESVLPQVKERPKKYLEQMSNKSRLERVRNKIIKQSQPEESYRAQINRLTHMQN
jgi:hypothetical protein